MPLPKQSSHFFFSTTQSRRESPLTHLTLRLWTDPREQAARVRLSRRQARRRGGRCHDVRPRFPRGPRVRSRGSPPVRVPAGAAEGPGGAAPLGVLLRQKRGLKRWRGDHGRHPHQPIPALSPRRWCDSEVMVMTPHHRVV